MKIDPLDLQRVDSPIRIDDLKYFWWIAYQRAIKNKKVNNDSEYKAEYMIEAGLTMK